MTQHRAILWFAIFTATLLVLPWKTVAQSGTVTDDAFLSSNANTQVLNLNGQGIVLIVAGSSAVVGNSNVGTTKTYIKFQLQSSLPPTVGAANVAKATLKLYLSPLTKPSGAIDVYPVTSAWTESTLNASSPPALASTAFATQIPVGQANSFLLVDVTQLVQEWLNGLPNGGLANDGIALVADTSTTYVVFDSRKNIVTSHEPRLEIVLVNSGPQGPAGLQGPKGDTGSVGSPGTSGAAASVQVGTTMTVSAGTPAAVLNGGTSSAAVLNFLIPQGPMGLTGPPGPVLSDLVYTDKSNTFTSNQILQGNMALAPMAPATVVQGFSSNPLDLQASAFDGANPQQQVFRWQAEPTGNGAASPSGSLNLLFGSNGTKPSETGFSIGSNGLLTFASGQTFPGTTSFTAGGDLIGTPFSQTVNALRGIPLSFGTGGPGNGYVLSFANGAWTSVPGFVPGGDLIGTATSQTVNALRGIPLSFGTGALTAGQVLGFNGTAWVPSTVPAGAQGTPGTAATIQVGQVATGGPGTSASVSNVGSQTAAVLNFTIPQGPPGPQGPSGPAGAAGAGTGGFNGIQEFTQTGIFTVPAGITHLLVEMWGAGGGGGGIGESVLNSNGTGLCFGGVGGVGGSGGHTRAVVPVTPGATYNVIVGAGGNAGSTASGANGAPTGGTNGSVGNDSQIVDSSGNVLASVGGGQGGTGGTGATADTITGACSGSTNGTPGAGGSGGSGASVVGRTGTVGVSAGSGTVALAPIGSIPLPVFGSATAASGGSPGGPGAKGYALINW